MTDRIAEFVGPQEVPSLHKRSISFTKGMKGGVGCDAIKCKENTFAVVDGKANEGAEDAVESRSQAEATIHELLIAPSLTNIGSIEGIDRAVFSYGVQRESFVPRVKGVSRGGGYVIAWDVPTGEKIYHLEPRIIYKEEDSSDVKMQEWEIINKGPLTYAAVFTDGGLELMRFLHLFTDGATDWTPDVHEHLERVEKLCRNKDLSDNSVLFMLKNLTWYLNGLTLNDIPLRESSLARQLADFQLTPGDSFYDDCSMLLLELWNPGHPSYAKIQRRL